MIRKEKNGIHWLEFEIFSEYPLFRHAICLRHGGVSPPPFNTLNLSIGAGDNYENVMENYQRILDAFGLEKIMFPHIEHGATVAHIRSLDAPKMTCDALMTAQTGLPLGVTHADCQTALFFDPKEAAIAVVHCGWRSQVQNIYQKTIEAMREGFASRPENILVGVGPSLGPKRAEFIHYENEFPKELHRFKRDDNCFDLWELSRWQLEMSGVQPEHIQIAQICTYDNPHDFFSYRGEKPATGRQATFALLSI